MKKIRKKKRFISQTVGKLVALNEIIRVRKFAGIIDKIQLHFR